MASWCWKFVGDCIRAILRIDWQSRILGGLSQLLFNTPNTLLQQEDSFNLLKVQNQEMQSKLCSAMNQIVDLESEIQNRQTRHEEELEYMQQKAENEIREMQSMFQSFETAIRAELVESRQEFNNAMGICCGVCTERIRDYLRTPKAIRNVWR